MRIIPYERLTLRTPVRPEEVAAKLGLRSERPGSEARGGRFVFTFRPPQLQERLPVVIVVGDIVAASDGTEVRVAMRPDSLSAAISLGLCGLLLVIILGTILSGLRSGFSPGGRLLGLAVVVPLLFAVWWFLNARFWREADQTRHLLRQTLGCQRAVPDAGVSD